MIELITTAKKETEYKDLPSTRLNVGDSFSCTLGNGEEVTFRVAGIKDGLAYIGTDDCLLDEAPMNEKWTNEGGYPASDRREYLNTDILLRLPEALRNIIVPRKIRQRMKDGSEVECTCMIWDWSATEMAGPDHFLAAADIGDFQMPLFKHERGRVKECGEYGTYPYFLRSPYLTSDTNFAYVYSGGYLNGNNATYSVGVSFGFCINQPSDECEASAEG